MNVFDKWTLKQILTLEEGCDILNELYGGAKKHFVFGSKVRIDKKFLDVYEKFKNGDDTNCVLKFSNIVTQKPFVSPILFPEENPTHTILTEEINLYVYEKNDLY
jgi:hypothetical protein